MGHNGENKITEVLLFNKLPSSIASLSLSLIISLSHWSASLLICTVEVSCERAAILVSILLPFCPLLLKSPSYVHSSYLHAGASFCKFHLPTVEVGKYYLSSNGAPRPSQPLHTMSCNLAIKCTIE